jgi:hypothetical protein
MSKHKERIMDKYKDSAVCPGCGLPAEVCGTLEDQRTKIIAFRQTIDGMIATMQRLKDALDDNLGPEYDSSNEIQQ